MIVDTRGFGDGPVAQLGTPGQFGPNYNQWGDPITAAGVAASAASYAAMQPQAIANAVIQANGLSYSDLLAQANFENCNAGDSVCVAYNQAKRDTVAKYWASHSGAVPLGTRLTFPVFTPEQIASVKQQAQPGPQPGAFITPVLSPLSQIINPTPSVPVVSITPKVGTFKWTASREGQLYYPGDTWNITINGATANSPVSVSNAGSVAVYGNTDSNGNWSKSGTFDASVVGNWSETWMVGGVTVGYAVFTVAPKIVAPVLVPSAPPPSQPPVDTSTNVVNSGVFELFGGEPLFSIGGYQIGEYTGLLALGVVLVSGYMMSKGRGR